jgi:hypothetical protein
MLSLGRISPEEVGRKLVAGRATRGWADEDNAEEHLTRLLEGDAFNRSLVSPAQAEKMLAGIFKDSLKPLISETRGVSLAPIDDPHPAVGGNVKQIFDEVIL